MDNPRILKVITHDEWKGNTGLLKEQKRMAYLYEQV